jgi:voltage-dependent anion channel protein 2
VSSLLVGGLPAFWFYAIVYVIWRLGYTQALRPGVKASFGLALDTQRLNDASPSGPAHKVGAQFVFEA